MSVLVIVLLSLRATLGLVLVAAGAAKLVDLHGFGETARGLGVPERWASSTALALAASELAVGTISLLGVWPQLADIAVFTLITVFVWVTFFAVRRRPQLRCRCFGALANLRLGVRALARSLLLLVAASAVLAGEIHGTVPVEASGMFRALLAMGSAAVAVATAEAARVVEIVRKEAGMS